MRKTTLFLILFRFLISIAKIRQKKQQNKKDC